MVQKSYQNPFKGMSCRERQNLKSKTVDPPDITYLEGHGDLVNRLITPISHIVSPFIPIINLLTKSP